MPIYLNFIDRDFYNSNQYFICEKVFQLKIFQFVIYSGVHSFLWQNPS